VLALRFISGETYEYMSVAAEVFAALKTADSKGRFVNGVVKPRYRFRHLGV